MNGGEVLGMQVALVCRFVLKANEFFSTSGCPAMMKRNPGSKENLRVNGTERQHDEGEGHE